MTYVVSLTDFTPIPRHDGIPWSNAHIEEALVPEGPWAELDNRVLTEDDDPANPTPRSFTLTNAQYAEGWYRVWFEDGDGNRSVPTEPVQNVPDETVPYWPLVSDIGFLLRARTKDTHGTEVGTFTGDTRPNYEQVSGIILQAANDVTAGLDTDIPEDAFRHVRQAIAIKAAMYVELSFFPEQVSSDRSPYQELKEMYADLWPLVKEAVAREAEEEVYGEMPPTSGLPRFTFPSADELVGWETSL